MKTLSTSDQIDLQSFIQGLKDNTSINWSIEEQGFLSYWAIELKPKRVRKKDEEKIIIGMTEAVEYAQNSVDNTVEV